MLNIYSYMYSRMGTIGIAVTVSVMAMPYLAIYLLRSPYYHELFHAIAIRIYDEISEIIIARRYLIPQKK